MNAKKMIAAVVVSIVAGSAFADATSNSDDFSKFVSTKTRSDTVAELVKARADGSFSATDGEKYPGQPVASTKTRAEVIAELAQSKTDGDYARSEIIYIGN